MSTDLIIAILAALGSAVTSILGIRAIIKHEMKMCDARMEAFKEGLDRGEKSH